VVLSDGQNLSEHVVLDVDGAGRRGQGAGVRPAVVPVDGMEEVVHERGDGGLVVSPGARGAVSVGGGRDSGVRLKVGLDPVEEGVGGGLELRVDLGADLEHDAKSGGDGVVLVVGKSAVAQAIGVVHPVDLGVHLLTVDGVLGLVVDMELGDLEATGSAHVEHVVGGEVA